MLIAIIVKLIFNIRHRDSIYRTKDKKGRNLENKKQKAKIIDTYVFICITLRFLNV